MATILLWHVFQKQPKARPNYWLKDEGVIAGIDFAKQVFAYVDSQLKIETLLKDGDEVNYGDIAFYVEGSSLSILTAERLVLNAMQRMSAIATKKPAFL